MFELEVFRKTLHIWTLHGKYKELHNWKIFAKLTSAFPQFNSLMKYQVTQVTSLISALSLFFKTSNF